MICSLVLAQTDIKRDEKELEEFQKNLARWLDGNGEAGFYLSSAIEREVEQGRQQLARTNANIGRTRVILADDMLQLQSVESAQQKKELKKDVKLRVRSFNRQEKSLKRLEKLVSLQTRIAKDVRQTTNPKKLAELYNTFEQSMIQDIGDQQHRLSMKH